MRVGKEIGLEAKKKNICKEWFSDMLKYGDIKPLCDMFFKGSDWSLENDFPALITLRKFKGNSDQHGLYTDFIGSVGLVSTATAQNAAFFGDTNADVICEPFTVCNLSIRHNSKVKITAKENAFIVVSLLDNSFVEIEANDSARVLVYQYGSMSNFRVSGNVEVKAASWQK